MKHVSNQNGVGLLFMTGMVKIQHHFGTFSKHDYHLIGNMG